MKEPTCFKNVENPSCIDLILTNKPLCFQNTMVMETGLSDFHKFTISTMKFNFHKQKPIIVKYRNNKYFNNDHFGMNYLIRLAKKLFKTLNAMSLNSFFMPVLNKHAPLKTKYIRSNNSPFMNKNAGQSNYG